MLLQRTIKEFLIVVLSFSAGVTAGPYTEAGVNGFVGADRRHADPLQDADAMINPIFRGWATGFRNYAPGDHDWIGPGVWNDPNKALGPVTGANFDIVSLGDLDQTEIAAGAPPGEITLVFGDPDDADDPAHIRDVAGYDFVVFENGFISSFQTSGGSIEGEMLSELGYVEVSSDGVNFARFPAVSLTAAPVGPYGTIDVTDVYNLAGKHPNAYGVCTGTPFDLQDIGLTPPVADGLVDIDNISFVRIVDIPGSGDFTDQAVEHIDPGSRAQWDYYQGNHSMYDAWVTSGSGGLDVEAVGVLNSQEYSADIDLDGRVGAFDFALFASSWQKHFGDEGWIGRCNLAEADGDLVIDFLDFAVFADQWSREEQWRTER